VYSYTYIYVCIYIYAYIKHRRAGFELVKLKHGRFSVHVLLIYKYVYIYTFRVNPSRGRRERSVGDAASRAVAAAAVGAANTSWPLQENGSLQGFCARVNHPNIAPPPRPALPTPLQYYCTSIAQYTTPPPDPSCMCRTPYNIDDGNIVLRPTAGAANTSSKGFALTWYRALTLYFLRVSSLRTHLELWTAVDTRGRGSRAAR